MYKWTELFVMQADCDGPMGSRFVPLTAELARTYAGPLAEYRNGGGAQGLFIATESEAASYDPETDDGNTCWKFGPEPDAVDWSGFPEAE